ncbi:hypothetical protein SAMN05444396_106189 [Flavobacterium segetis]|uniref:YhhN-like protein n=1 Tax=Flavobacterium segetis TaxID=271157 RepID=A0A1M5I6K1_9FLAO|nr:hypothetical protein [Flavobacterium segetis]SHG23984.1 hypothetical protein SAMN05444396_106189 [Flavobacterium segetis]
MENFIKQNTLLLLPIFLLVIYFCAGVFYNPAYVIYIKPLIIPSFLVYAVKSNITNLSKNYFLFVFFFFLQEILLLFWQDSLQFFRAALIASFCCYIALILLGYKSIKNKEIQIFPSGYTLFILGLNCVFLVAIIFILASAISDEFLNIIIIFNAITAILLGATAVTYLGKYGDSKAYYFFFGAFALIFNDVFAAVATYFVQNIFLNALDRILHFTSFYLIYLFMISTKKKVENHTIDLQP